MCKIKKISTSIFACVFAMLLMCNSASAKTIGVDYKSIGGRFLWATSPEMVRNSTAQYVYGCSVNTDKYLDVEIYQHNNTGKTLRFGVVVCNNNYSDIKLNIAGKAITAHDNSEDIKTNHEKKLSAVVDKVILPFKKGRGAGTITIPARSTKFVLYADAADNHLVTGRISMKSNKSNVYARVVHGPISTTPKHYFTLTELEEGKNFCGILSYIGKKATVDAKVGDTFNLFEYHEEVENDINTGEHNGVESYKRGGEEYLKGNFSIVYDLTFKGARGKTLKISPRYAPAGARILFNTNGTWYSTNYITSNGCWKIPLGSDANVKLLLPSGNCSNMKAELIN